MFLNDYNSLCVEFPQEKAHNKELFDKYFFFPYHKAHINSLHGGQRGRGFGKQK